MGVFQFVNFQRGIHIQLTSKRSILTQLQVNTPEQLLTAVIYVVGIVVECYCTKNHFVLQRPGGNVPSKTVDTAPDRINTLKKTVDLNEKLR